MANDIAVREPVSAIDQAFELAQKHPRQKGLEEEYDALRQASKVLLPIEAKAHAKTKQRIAELETLLLHDGLQGHTWLPLDPLSWRHPSGMPKIAMMSLNTHVFQVGAWRSRETGSFTKTIGFELPREAQEFYSDVLAVAQSRCVRNGSSCAFSFEFDGVVPQSTRIALGDAIASKKFEQFFMLVESPEEAWLVEEKKGVHPLRFMVEEGVRKTTALGNAWADRLSAMQIDPIVVGWAGGKMWVIDKFDVTSMEQYVLDEFGRKALLPG